MNIFPHFNAEGAPCSICKLHTDSLCCLIPMPHTSHDGLVEALQVHVECLNLEAIKSGDGKIYVINKDVLEMSK